MRLGKLYLLPLEFRGFLKQKLIRVLALIKSSFNFLLKLNSTRAKQQQVI